jgi:hypothetical protein
MCIFFFDLTLYIADKTKTTKASPAKSLIYLVTFNSGLFTIFLGLGKWLAWRGWVTALVSYDRHACFFIYRTVLTLLLVICVTDHFSSTDHFTYLRMNESGKGTEQILG